MISTVKEDKCLGFSELEIEDLIQIPVLMFDAARLPYPWGVSTQLTAREARTNTDAVLQGLAPHSDKIPDLISDIKLAGLMQKPHVAQSFKMLARPLSQDGAPYSDSLQLTGENARLKGVMAPQAAVLFPLPSHWTVRDYFEAIAAWPVAKGVELPHESVFQEVRKIELLSMAGRCLQGLSALDQEETSDVYKQMDADLFALECAGKLSVSAQAKELFLDTRLLSPFIRQIDPDSVAPFLLGEEPALDICDAVYRELNLRSYYELAGRDQPDDEDVELFTRPSSAKLSDAEMIRRDFLVRELVSVAFSVPSIQRAPEHRLLALGRLVDDDSPFCLTLTQKVALHTVKAARRYLPEL